MATNYQPTFMWLLRNGLQHPAPCRRLFLGSWRRRPQLSLLGGEEPKDCNPFWFAGPPGQGAHFLISERSWIKKKPISWSSFDTWWGCYSGDKDTGTEGEQM